MQKQHRMLLLPDTGILEGYIFTNQEGQTEGGSRELEPSQKSGTINLLEDY
jgi:hypothetical protein